MPELKDLHVEGDDEHGYRVRHRLHLGTHEGREGGLLGHIHRRDDGTYVPSGDGATSDYPMPAANLAEALEAFVSRN
ncbi:hypothetical protein F6J84_08395 [Microbacterium caowuchunii]|uniref:hypothetical protein n=1 Tax=Microbacterium caowuchunii TaxID=2614638 RepID=UPI0012441965|nr:hypothetical protein [Microbacterium caowuchunii]QEW00114.1 hypothetical protein F6J84_08395 [Microbacterium caowuchunii]